jgi:hypothetical protein
MTNVEWLPLGVFTSPARSGGLAYESSLDELLKQAPAATIVTPAGRQSHSLVLVPANERAGRGRNGFAARSHRRQR